MLNADIKNFKFTSDHDGLEISALISVPSSPDFNGVVQIVHDMCDYKERYMPFIDYLAAEGFICVIHDNRGHGQSICSEDDLGFLYKNGDVGYVDDIHQLSTIVKQVYPSLPYFLIGFGMGSLGARAFIKRYDTEINGLFIVGSPSFKRFSKFAFNVETALMQKMGSHYRSDEINSILQTTLSKPFKNENTNFPWICSDSNVVSAYAADPNCNFIFTLNGYSALLSLLRQVYSDEGWRVENSHLPIRFISGQNDPCMISEKRFFKSVQMLENLGYESVSHRLFDGMRHEILNESDCLTVYKDIAKSLYSWIDRL